MMSEMGINVVETEEADSDDEEGGREEPEEEEAEGGELVEVTPKTPAKSEAKSRPSAPTIRYACTCAKWARWSCFRAKAKSPSPSASRPAARP